MPQNQKPVVGFLELDRANLVRLPWAQPFVPCLHQARCAEEWPSHGAQLAAVGRRKLDGSRRLEEVVESIDHGLICEELEEICVTSWGEATAKDVHHDLNVLGAHVAILGELGAQPLSDAGRLFV